MFWRVNQREKGWWEWWEDIVTSHLEKMLLHMLFACIAVVFLAFWKSDPHVVVLMDTFAAGAVYDAEKLTELLQEILPDHKLHFEALASDWSRETAVAAMRPRLVIINRSALFDSYHAEDKLGPTNGSPIKQTIRE